MQVAATGDVTSRNGTLHADRALDIEAEGTLRNISGRIGGNTVRLAAAEIRMETAVRSYGSGDNTSEVADATALVRDWLDRPSMWPMPEQRGLGSAVAKSIARVHEGRLEWVEGGLRLSLPREDQP